MTGHRSECIKQLGPAGGPELRMPEPRQSVMKCNHLLSWAFVLVGSCPLLAHPITESSEVAFPRVVSMEDRGIGALDDLALAEQTFPPQDGAALRYSTFISGEMTADDVRATSLLPRGVKRAVSLEKTNLLKPYSHMLGIRKQFRKRSGNSECFWKYCV